ncbi:protein-L-isoaspartate(D-aspartate) O-methyltransferase [Gilvimarinus sp. F26214L]|uniref:protein-L-isoaspartate(D-aspartate) O-methyltransferase n=1 Tax=Gilvimarinus sp. DZF01 TaxID=3461371 RepID=UPI0040454C0A
MLDPQAFATRRHAMVEQQLKARGVHSPQVLEAMDRVHRESFLPDQLRDAAYQDSPLPIAEGQTISQPYIVGFMLDALQLEGGERVLEVGTGSGYGAAVLAEIAAQVITVERHRPLAVRARRVLRELHYHNVEVIHGDGSQGWPAGAPYDAILITAGAPNVPSALKQQIRVGGRLILPVGLSETRQQLIRVTRRAENDYLEEALLDVQFVPLVGRGGWRSGRTLSGARCLARPRKLDLSLPELMRAEAEPMDDPDSCDLDPLLERIADARVVCLGEASHGTAEFYRFRARITRELIEKKNFDFVAVEADWPDAARIDHYVRHLDVPPSSWTAFTRFPTWMWRNRQVQDFVEWLHERNRQFDTPGQRVAFHGLDLYSMFTSIGAVLGYLERTDRQTARIARERYGCLFPWEDDPIHYGRAAASGKFDECEKQVVGMLAELLEKRLGYSARDGERFFDAVQNARLVANAERYYRSMYEGYSDSWNLRDSHMFDTLQNLFNHHGEDSRAVIWAHNSHLGDASETDMARRGQHNLGQLCRQAYGDQAYLIGFGTHGGTVMAASEWGGPMQVKTVRPSLPESWERSAHDTGLGNFLLGLRDADPPELKELLGEERLERAIGVIYRPESERASHYFKARLGRQFDEYIWFDDTRAVEPLDSKMLKGMPDTYPFGL